MKVINWHKKGSIRANHKEIELDSEPFWLSASSKGLITLILQDEVDKRMKIKFDKTEAIRLRDELDAMINSLEQYEKGNLD
jgi:hypothetical protein